MAEDKGVEVVVMTVRLKSGRFESSVELPLNCSDAEKKRFVESWLALMSAGLQCGLSSERASGAEDGA